MAVAIDASTGINESASGATSLTISHTCGGSATYLLVFVADWQGDTVTGVTYNGVAMTQLCKETRTPDSGSLEIYWYGLGSPATGANNVVISRSGTVAWINGGVISLTGSSTTTSPVDATATEPGAAGQSTDTLSITTVADNTAVFIAGVADNGGIAASTNSTELLSSAGLPLGNDATIVMRSTTFPKTPAGAATYSMSFNANSGHCMVAVSIAPPVSGPATLESWDTVAKANIETMDTVSLANIESWNTVA